MKVSRKFTGDFTKLDIAQLKEMYKATFGCFPAGFHSENREHYLAIFNRHVKFGRQLFTF